jgi:glycosyltransferase involved in cell wall biosynthesis
MGIANLRDEIERLTARDFDVVHIPPVIPDELPQVVPRPAASDGSIKIGYAGKINSRWGVIELLQWAEKLIGEGVALELHIVADKITNGPDPGFENLRHDITTKMKAVGAKHYTGLNRGAAMDLMARMDFVWCYRPSMLEDHTLELSTKLVEMVAVEARCLCYPNTINQEALGEDYPFFIDGLDDLRRVLTAREWKTTDKSTAERVRQRHSLSRVIADAGGRLVPRSECDDPARNRCIVFSGHDFKFIDAYLSDLKMRTGPVAKGAWHWSAVQNQDALMRLHRRADIVFCEWGLANAVWHSKNSPAHQRLLIRIHAQEVRERARRFGAAIDATNVDRFIFVSEEIRDIALDMWDWPAEKTVVVPNYVLGHEFAAIDRPAPKQVVLGMVGIVPRLKRLDRAIDLLEHMLKNDVDARLRIKGHRPENLEYMHAPGRRPELDYYSKQYERIANSRLLQSRVHFDPWGNDIATWYGRVHVILSCSESESFHYALADGVLTGCLPVVWPWPGAERTFDQDWIVNDTAAAARRILDWMKTPDVARSKLARQNRDLILQRYGSEKVFPILDDVILGASSSRD